MKPITERANGKRQDAHYLLLRANLIEKRV